jgi:hypothetical protein
MAGVSLVKSCQEFFSMGRHGRKIEIPEFKALTRQDKEELREMLIGEGYDVLPLPLPDNTSE